MKRWILGGVNLAVISAVIAAVMIQTPTQAAGTCSATVAPGTVTPTSSHSYSIAVTNTGNTDINWLSIGVPSSHFTFAGSSISGWSTADNPNGITLSGNSIGQGQTETFSISATANIINVPSADWQIQVSDDGTGADQSPCSGDIGTAISGRPPNDTVNGVTDISATSLSPTSVRISWTSDNPTSSVVYFGKTSGYESVSSYDPTLTTDHSIVLNNLSSSTGYHFQVAGSDGQGGFAYSADNTFLTDKGASKPTTPSSSSPQSTVVGKGPLADRVAPQISFLTILSGTYKSVPQLSGTAYDETVLLKVEYSTDDGKNWLPAEVQKKPLPLKSTFTFTPALNQDGNYKVVARATDGQGNTTTTGSQVLIIDRLPPFVGGNVVTVGPLIIQPAQDGTIYSVQGVDQKITLSAVGGPTSVTLEAVLITNTASKDKKVSQSFSLTKSEDNGLWSGLMGFSRPGHYEVTARAIDGAGNETNRTFNSINVSKNASVLDSSTSRPVKARISVYYREPTSQEWVLWDAAAFNQVNPQNSNEKGQFNLFLPAGKYYLKVQASGYKTLTGSIFTVKTPSPLTTELRMNNATSLRLGSSTVSLPSLSIHEMKIDSTVPKNVSVHPLIGKQAPDMALLDTEGKLIRTIDLLGRNTLLSFNSTWSPTTSEQIDILAKLQTNKDMNIVPVALQEGGGRIGAYNALAGTSLRWVLDPDSSLSTPYNILSMPTHYFIDRKGIVREVTTAVLSEKMIIERLSKL